MNPKQDEKHPRPITKEALYKVIDLMVSASAHAGEGGRSPGEAWLNPQPLPPREASEPSHPDPWRSAAVARQIIGMASLSSAAAADRQTGLRTAQSMLEVFIDDFCGAATPSRRLPLPPPWPRSAIKPNAIDLLVAAAQFQAVASALQGEPIAKSLKAGADRLLNVGLQRLTD